MLTEHRQAAVMVAHVLMAAVMPQLPLNVTRPQLVRVILFYVLQSISNGFLLANKPKHLQK